MDGFSRDSLASVPTSLPWRQRVAALIAALLYAIFLLGLGGAAPSALYGYHPCHRLQAAALLEGHFYLSDSIYAVHFDNAFCAGKVQQVWGLGVGLWLMPFELLGRLIGVTPFPDRIAMGVALLLFAYYTLGTALRFARSGTPPLTATAMTYLFLLAPPLWTLTVKGPQTVYEDTSIYALIVSLAILVSVIRVAAFSTLSDYWLCCGLAALSGLVRPTHAIYGVISVGLCFWILYLRKVARMHLLAGAALMLGGMVFLAVSNQVRFGSPLEFGHRLTATTVEGILTSRFVNPIENASVWAAAKELFGALFLSLGDIRDKGDWDAGLFPGQTPFMRWRNWYVTTYDPTLLLWLVFGLVAWFAWWFPQGPRSAAKGNLPRLSQRSLFFSLAGWSVATVIPLYIFMLYYPGLCARYLYDFWPGFAGLLVVALIWSSKTTPAPASLSLIGWLGFQLWRADCRWPRMLPVGRAEMSAQLAGSGDTHLEVFHGRFDQAQHPSDLVRTGRPFLTAGWEKASGCARFSVMVPVDRPEFVQLWVGRRLRTTGDSGRADVYRARIGNLVLPLTSVEADTDGESLLVRFAVPERLRQRTGDELLFLCFVSLGDWEDWDSQRILHSLRWR